MTNVPEKGRWYLSWEVRAGVFVLALGLLSAAALVASFFEAREVTGASRAWEVPGLMPKLPPSLARLLPPLMAFLLGLAAGFLYGRISLSTAAEDGMSFTEAYNHLNDVSLRQLRSGSTAHVRQVADLARTAEASRQAARLAKDIIWRISSQLDSGALQHQLAAAIGARRLRAWLANASSPPAVGRETTLEFRFEPFEPGVADTDAAAEPSSAVESLLLVHVASEQVEVKHSSARVNLPASGPSSTVKVVIVPRVPGACALSFLVHAEGTLELLQTYNTTIEVEAPAEGGTNL